MIALFIWLVYFIGLRHDGSRASHWRDQMWSRHVTHSEEGGSRKPSRGALQWLAHKPGTCFIGVRNKRTCSGFLSSHFVFHKNSNTYIGSCIFHATLSLVPVFNVSNLDLFSNIMGQMLLFLTPQHMLERVASGHSNTCLAIVRRDVLGNRTRAHAGMHILKPHVSSG